MKKIFLLIMVSLLVFTGCGGSKEDKETNDNKDSKLSSYKAVWRIDDSAIPTEEIIINSIDESKVSFDYVLYRLGEFKNIEGKIDGNVATFSATNDIEWTIKGTLTFADNKVIVEIKESSVELINKGKNTFAVKGDKSIIREGNEQNITEEFLKYKGVWRNDDSDNPVDEFIINDINGKTVSFDYLIYRVTTFENAKAEFDGQTAVFDIKNDLGWNLKGFFLMNNDQVILTITECSDNNIIPSTTIYNLHRDKSKLK
jgi:hypothetical protein